MPDWQFQDSMETSSRSRARLREVISRRLINEVGSVLYSSSISLSAACTGGRHTVVGSGGLNTASRSIAVR